MVDQWVPMRIATEKPRGKPAAAMPRRQAPGRGTRSRVYVVLALVSVVLLTLIVTMPLFDSADTGAKLDDDLCPPDTTTISDRTVLLLDFRKPLGEANLPGALLRRITGGMTAGGELRVFAVASDPLAPRVPLGRLCKPYANADLAVAMAKDQPAVQRDCDDLPAQLPRSLRPRVKRFCDHREALQQRLANLAEGQPKSPVANAYLIEAIDDTRLELAGTREPATLYVFSDMLQHAAWYSHPERGPNAWSYADLERQRALQTGIVSEPPPPDPQLAVTIFYVPRRGLTEHPRVARVHERFWRGYFGDIGTLTFEAQSMRDSYDVTPQAGASSGVADLDPSAATVPTAKAGPVGSELADATADGTVAADPRGPADEALREAEPPEAGNRPPAPAAAEPRRQAESPPAADQPQSMPADANPSVAADAERNIEPPPAEDGTPSAAGGAAPGPGIASTPAADLADGDERDADTPAAPPASDERPARAESEDERDAGTPAAAPASDERPARAESGIPAGNPPDPRSGEGVEPAAPAIADASESEGVSDLPAAPSTDSVACAARLRSEFVGVDLYPQDRHPKRLRGALSAKGQSVDYGSADIVVEYTIDENGQTVDAEVAFRPDLSEADRPRHLDLFVRQAETAVRGWTFDFEGGGDCVKRQQKATRFQFHYRR